jgi:hypothetical protein
MERWLRRQDAAVERTALRMKPKTPPLVELLDLIENGREVPEDLKERILLLRLRLRHSKLVCSLQSLSQEFLARKRECDE